MRHHVVVIILVPVHATILYRAINTRNKSLGKGRRALPIHTLQLCVEFDTSRNVPEYPIHQGISGGETLQATVPQSQHARNIQTRHNAREAFQLGMTQS